MVVLGGGIGMGEGLCRLIGLSVLCRCVECAKPDAADARTFTRLAVVPGVLLAREAVVADDAGPDATGLGALEPR